MAEANMLARPVLLIAYSEIALKGKKRHLMERTLRKHVYMKLTRWGIKRKVFLDQGRIVVWGGGPISIRRMPGVHHVIRALALEKVEPERLAETVAGLVKVEGKFAVRVRRADKRYPLNSVQLASLIGSKIEGEVDLKNPDTEVFVEIRDLIYVYTNKDVYDGVGGLPYGVEGRVYVDSNEVLLTSALLARRGAEVIPSKPVEGLERLNEALPYPLVVLRERPPGVPSSSELFELDCVPTTTLRRVRLMLGEEA